VAVPAVLSFALHALLFAICCFLSGQGDEPSPTIVDTRVDGRWTLSLASVPGLGQQSQAPSAPAGNEQEIKVAEILPPPLVGSVADHAPPVVLPREHTSGTPDNSATGSGPAEVGPGNGSAGFLRVARPVRSVVYVIDCSMSMGGADRKFARARDEVLASLHELPAATMFQVIPFNSTAATLSLQGQRGLVAKSDAAVLEVARDLEGRKPKDGTNFYAALRCGLDLRPEVLFFVTDGEDLPSEVVRDATSRNKSHTEIQVVQLSIDPARPDSPLRTLATTNAGTYRHVPLGR
jgi:hypothetical protein